VSALEAHVAKRGQRSSRPSRRRVSLGDAARLGPEAERRVVDVVLDAKARATSRTPRS